MALKYNEPRFTKNRLNGSNVVFKNDSDNFNKTPIQIKIENSVTNNLGYTTLSYNYRNGLSLIIDEKNYPNNYFENTNDDLSAHLGELELKTTKSPSYELKNAVSAKIACARAMILLFEKERPSLIYGSISNIINYSSKNEDIHPFDLLKNSSSK